MISREKWSNLGQLKKFKKIVYGKKIFKTHKNYIFLYLKHSPIKQI